MTICATMFTVREVTLDTIVGTGQTTLSNALCLAAHRFT